MNLIRLLLGRRQFLIAFIISSLKLAFGRTARAFDLLRDEKVSQEQIPFSLLQVAGNSIPKD